MLGYSSKIALVSCILVLVIAIFFFFFFLGRNGKFIKTKEQTQDQDMTC